ncbi:MAG: ATP-binding cassette domain-containing protein [Spirochaetia bacterium]|jgi:zinc/manganese transport system ATP-binding protein
MNAISEPPDAAVSLTQVSVRLGGLTIQNGMSFRLSSGEFVAILGPNGAGKSTLLKMLLGLLRPFEGEVRVLGKVPRTGNQQVGYLPQFLNLDSMNTLRARDIVGFGLDGHRWGLGLFSRDRERKLDKILEEVDALSFSRAAFDELSGGERQRLLLAQALISDPQLLLLDEPLASLDIAHSQEVITLVARICRSRKITILLVTHDVNPLLPHIDKVLYLANGRSALGRPDEVITSEVLSRLYGSRVDVVSAQGRRFVIGAET